MKAGILFLSAALLCLNLSVAMAADAPPADGSQETAAPQQGDGEKNDGAFERYMERRGERLDKEMENVMKPMQKGMEGIRGTTNPKEEEKPEEKPQQQK